MAPRFSIVVPTRNRAATLQHTLRTCLAQRYDDYEVIIADNASTPETRDVVFRLGSPKVRYLRSDQPLAMSDNWERGVAAATGEYTIVIGDDDALMLHALRSLDQILTAKPARILRWERAHYGWPDLELLPEFRNILLLPLVARDRTLSGRRVLLDAANAGDAGTLPMLYNSAVRRDLLAELRRRAGRVFLAAAPDVSSGMAFAYLVGRYESTGVPMTINGGSAKSNGVAHGRTSSPIYKDFWSLNERAGFGVHPTVPNVPTIASIQADAFQRTKDALFPADGSLSLDLRRVAAACAQELSSVPDEQWRTDLHAISASLAPNSSSQRWFARRFDVTRRPAFTPPQTPRPALGFNYRSLLVLDASEFGVSDVYGAAELCERIAHLSDTAPSVLNNVWCNIRTRVRYGARMLLRGY